MDAVSRNEWSWNVDSAEPESERELVVSRRFDAPRELVFDSWTDPRHLERWWGPDGFTTTVRHADIRPGGSWRYTMHGPDGTDYENLIVYEVVDRPERIVYLHGEREEDGPLFHVTVTFREQGDGTELTMRMLLPSAEALRNMKEFGAAEGAQQTLARLAELLAERRRG